MSIYIILYLIGIIISTIILSLNTENIFKGYLDYDIKIIVCNFFISIFIWFLIIPISIISIIITKLKGY